MTARRLSDEELARRTRDMERHALLAARQRRLIGQLARNDREMRRIERRLRQ